MSKNLSPTPYERLSSSHGFTLIELLIVVLIIGILASIAIPVFNGQRNKTKDAQAMSSVRNALTAAKSHYTSTETFESANAAALAGEESSLEFVDGLPSITAGSDQADPKKVYVADQSKENITLCAVSKGSKVYCVKASGEGSTMYASNDLAANAPLAGVAAGSPNQFSTGWQPSWSGSNQLADNSGEENGPGSGEPGGENPGGSNPCLDFGYAMTHPTECSSGGPGGPSGPGGTDCTDPGQQMFNPACQGGGNPGGGSGGSCSDPMYAFANPTQCGGSGNPGGGSGGSCSDPMYAALNPTQCGGGTGNPGGPGGPGGNYARINVNTDSPNCGSSCGFSLTASTGMPAEAYSTGWSGSPSATFTQTSKTKSGSTLTITGTYSCNSGITGVQIFENGTPVDSIPITCS